MHEEIENSIQETHQILNRKEPTLKQRIERCPGNNFESVTDLCEDFLKNTSLNSISSLDVKEKLKKIPTFNDKAFLKIKDEILEFIKYKLK